jgi:hypothetical protein
MPRIRTTPLPEEEELLLKALEAEQAVYPVDYATPVPSDGAHGAALDSYTSIPESLFSAFPTFEALLQVLANQERILANQEKMLENQEKILAK